MNESINGFDETKLSSLVELLRTRARLHSERVAYIFLKDGEIEKEKFTYGQLDKKARTIAADLQEKKVVPGDRALLLYPPGLEYVAAFMGCLYAGVTAVPVYPPHPARLERSLSRLKSIVQSAKPKVALTIGPILELADALFRTDPDFGKMEWAATDRMEETFAEKWQNPSVKRDDLAFLQYTSGSTGKPKGVMVSHGNLLDNEAMIQSIFHLEEKSTIVSWLPLYHDMGLIGNVLYSMYVGTPCILISPIDFLKKPLRWLQAISKYRAILSGGPNFGYELCVRKTSPEERAKLDLSCWRVAFNGAEPLRHFTLERF